MRLDDCKPSDAYERLGKLHWIDVFPKSEYQNGIKKILQVVSPGTFLLRNNPIKLSEVEVEDIIRRHDFFDRYKNISGKGFYHQYKIREINGNKVVVDEASGLMWQQGGSPKSLYFKDAKSWIEELNQNVFASFRDWRLPTLEEAMSLMEPKKNEDDLFIHPAFEKKQNKIWTADLVTGDSGVARVVLFYYGHCHRYHFYTKIYVRAVRSG